MKSRKMVLTNLFVGQEWSHRCREWASGHSVGRSRGTNLESSADIYTLPRVKHLVGSSCTAQGAQPGAL